MEPPLFFAPIENIQGEQIELPATETHHALNVLRLRSGALVVVVDGLGTAYRGELRVESKKISKTGAVTSQLPYTLPEEREIRPERFLPSSRSVAFRRQDGLAIGGYPEWLDYCEDLVFDLRMQAHAGKPVWRPGAVARFRPRRRLASFARQYYLYARGDGKAGLWPRRHAVRYGVYGLAVPALTLIAAAGNAVGWLGLIGGILVMTARPYRRLVHQWSALSTGERLAAIGWVPAVRLVGDLAKMAGYPVGVAWRLRHRPPEWRPQAGGSGS